MERQGLITKVKIKLDEYTPEGVSLPFDTFIGPMLDESALEILDKAPLHLLTATILVVTGITYNDSKAYIIVPSDYVRLHEMKFPKWKRPVRVAISSNHPDFPIQENEFIRGGYARPSVIFRNSGLTSADPGRYLECSKVMQYEDGALVITTPTIATYIKTDKPENLPLRLAEALTWLCTSKILLIGGQADKAKLAYDQYINALKQ